MGRVVDLAGQVRHQIDPVELVFLSKLAAGRRNERGQQIKGTDRGAITLAGGEGLGPVQHEGHAHAAFPENALLSVERSIQRSVLIQRTAVVADKGDQGPIDQPLLLERLNIFTDPQKPIQVEPGVYPIGEPGADSPVFVTTNFSLTYFIVSGEIENAGVSAWLLIPECEGMSVLTAWAAGKFDSERIAKDVKRFEVGDKVDVIMIPKVEGPWDIHFVDRLLAQLEARGGVRRPILVHAILETALGVANVEEIAGASPRMQGMSFGPADLAAARRMKTTRIGGGHREIAGRHKLTSRGHRNPVNAGDDRLWKPKDAQHIKHKSGNRPIGLQTTFCG